MEWIVKLIQESQSINHLFTDLVIFVQSARAVEFADCISVGEG